MNPLELWNLSREMASVSHAVFKNDISFADVNAEYTHYPFTSEVEVVSLIERLQSELQAETPDENVSTKELINKLQHIIHERLKQIVDTTIDEDTDNTAVLTEWNTAQTVARLLLEWNTEDSNTQYTDIQTEYQNIAPETPEDAHSLLQTIQADTPKEKHNKLTQKLYNQQKDKQNTDTPTTQSPQNTATDKHHEIARKLYEAFKNRQSDVSYTDVRSEYNVSFPSRDVCMMQVMNLNISDTDTAINELAEWVTEWYGDEEATQELTRRSPRPMGSPI